MLTKRPELIADRLPSDWGTGYPNVWLGTTVEDQSQIQRLEQLVCVPAAIRFVSAEPLRGPGPLWSADPDARLGYHGLRECCKAAVEVLRLSFRR